MNERSWGFWHWQNFTAEKSPGAFPVHGRAHAHVTDGGTFRIEWNIASRSCGLRFGAEPGGEIRASLRFPPIALYLGAEVPKHHFLSRLADRLIALAPSDMNCRWSGRDIEVSIHDWALWWSLWTDNSGWTSSRPRWRDGSFHVLDALLGEQEHSSTLLEAGDITVCMPEGQYQGRCEIRRDTWKRPRAPARNVYRAHIDMKQPIPVPGKGENSYDCGEDAIFGLTCPARTFADAIGSVTMSALRDRERRGGLDWKPEPVGSAA